MNITMDNYQISREKSHDSLLVFSRHLTVYYKYKNCYLRGLQTFFIYYSERERERGGLEKHFTESSVEEFRIHNFQK